MNSMIIIKSAMKYTKLYLSFEITKHQPRRLTRDHISIN